MKECKKISEFCREVMRYAGSGYTLAKCVKIPKKKEHSMSEIKAKIRQNYGTDLSRGKRQWNKLKEIANFGAVKYQNFICILKTSGTSEINEKEFVNIVGLPLDVTPSLTLLLIRDGRKKLTFRLGKDTYYKFKGDYQKVFEEGDGRKFHTLQKKWSGFPHYNGIGLQRRSLNEFLNELKRIYKRQWNIMF